MIVFNFQIGPAKVFEKKMNRGCGNEGKCCLRLYLG